MEFTRLGENTVRCLITESEIADLGYSMDDILSNGSKTQEFMNRIFDIAAKNCRINFDTGVRTVRADFMPNHTLALTFSALPPEKLVEHVRELLGGMFNQAVEQTLQEMKEKKGPDAVPQRKEGGTLPDADMSPIVVLLIFKDFEHARNFALHLREKTVSESSLYRFEDEYYLTMNLSGLTKEDVFRLSAVTDEYVEYVEAGREKEAFLQEHGKIVIRKNALQLLKKLV